MTTRTKPGPRPSYTADQIETAMDAVQGSAAGLSLETVHAWLMEKGIGKTSRQDGFREAIKSAIQARQEARIATAIDALPESLVQSFDSAICQLSSNLRGQLALGFEKLTEASNEKVQQTRRDVTFRDARIAELIDQIAQKDEQIGKEGKQRTALELRLRRLEKQLAAAQDENIRVSTRNETLREMIDNLSRGEPTVRVLRDLRPTT